MNVWKNGVLCILGSLFILVVDCFVDSMLLFLISIVLFCVGCFYLLIGIFKLLQRGMRKVSLQKTKEGLTQIKIKSEQFKNEVASRKEISEETLTKIKEVEDCYCTKINEVEQQQALNRQDKNKLQDELNVKIKEKKQYDTEIKNFIKANTYNIKLGTSIDMISNVLVHNSKFIKLDDIVEVQVQCNSQVITQTNTVEERKARKGLVSTMGRAAVGVALTGGTPVGAVLGLTGTKKTIGRSSTTTTQKEMNTYKVIVLTSRIGDSIVSINCGNSEETALKVSNAINNACINAGTVDITNHEDNIIKSDELEFAIRDLRGEMKDLDKVYNTLKKTIKSLKQECEKEIKQLKKARD